MQNDVKWDIQQQIMVLNLFNGFCWFWRRCSLRSNPCTINIQGPFSKWSLFMNTFWSILQNILFCANIFLIRRLDWKCVRYSIALSHIRSCWSAFFNILGTIRSPLKIWWHLYYYVRSRRAYLLFGRNSFVYNKLDWYALKLFLKFIPLLNLFEKHTLIKLGRSHSWQTATQRKLSHFSTGKVKFRIDRYKFIFKNAVRKTNVAKVIRSFNM